MIAGIALSAWMGLVGALVKDLSDVRGDAIAGRKTWAVVFGAWRPARYAAVVALAVALAGTAASALLALILMPAMLVLLVGALLIAARARPDAALGRRVPPTIRSARAARDLRHLHANPADRPVVILLTLLTA